MRIPSKLLLSFLFAAVCSPSFAGAVQVEQYWEGFFYSYSQFPNNSATITATYDDSGLTGVGEEFLTLDSITFDISGGDAWAAGIRTFTSPSPFTARYVDGVYDALFGSTTFGATTLGFNGSLFASTLYHGTQWWYFQSDSGPVPLTTVPEPTGGLLLISGLMLLLRQRKVSVPSATP